MGHQQETTIIYKHGDIESRRRYHLEDTKLYTKCLSERRIPTAWKNVNMLIIFKKGTKKDLKNYRPICLSSNIYKVLTKVLRIKLEKTPDENQAQEETGFKGLYSTTDHIHAVN